MLALPDKADASVAEPQEQISHTLSNTIAELVPTTSGLAAPAPAPAKLRMSYRCPRANPSGDDVWTRHHSKCLMGVTCNLALGGIEAARLGAKGLIKATDPGKKLQEVCSWIFNASYLNLEGSAGLKKHGLQRCFNQWAANRVYYFYRGNEHPALGKRNNLRNVYRQFYDTFAADVAAEPPISEERARQFWQSVADIVPFKEPVSAMPAALEAILATAPSIEAVTASSGQAATVESL